MYHVFALSSVLGFTALLTLTNAATPFNALLLALGGLAGTMLIASVGAVGRAMLLGVVSAAQQEQNNQGRGAS